MRLVKDDLKLLVKLFPLAVKLLFCLALCLLVLFGFFLLAFKAVDFLPLQEIRYAFASFLTLVTLLLGWAVGRKRYGQKREGSEKSMRKSGFTKLTEYEE